MFTYTYKDLKGILLKLVQQRIESDISIPPTHQAKYRLNPNYVAVVEQDIDKLLTTRFIQLVKEAS